MQKQATNAKANKTKSNKKVDMYNIVVSLEALEISFPADKKNPKKEQYVTCVIKRGEQQRQENIDNKIKYRHLNTDDPGEMATNKRNYTQIMKERGQNPDEQFLDDLNQSDDLFKDFDKVRDSNIGGTEKGTPERGPSTQG